MLFEDRLLVWRKNPGQSQNKDSKKPGKEAVERSEAVYTWLRSLLNGKMQVFASVRDYKLNGSRITSILSDVRKLSAEKLKLDVNEDYLLRVKIDTPLMQVENMLLYQEFNMNGVS
jgi:hypothetical protein